MSWHTALFHRVKKMPKLKETMDKIFKLNKKEIPKNNFGEITKENIIKEAKKLGLKTPVGMG